MILNVRHAGIVVRDIERAAEFYRMLGFSERSHATEQGEFIDQVTGMDSTVLEWIKMDAPDGGFLLELLQYHSHPIQSPVVVSPSNALGSSHLAFTVEDIEKACELIVQGGGSVVNKPALSSGGEVKVAYCHDPEGVLMEVVEEL